MVNGTFPTYLIREIEKCRLFGEYMADEDENPEQSIPDEDIEVEEEEIVEEVDPLSEAISRAEAAEKEITYRDAEIQNVRKRLMAEKATAIQYGGMGLSRKMIAVLTDIDRALSVNEDEGLSLIRSKMWAELVSDGVVKIETKGERFDPTKMDAITTIPPSDDFPANTVVDELEAGYMYKDRVLTPARVVVSSDQ